jgi:flagellar biosynthesis protein FlgN
MSLSAAGRTAGSTVNRAASPAAHLAQEIEAADRLVALLKQEQEHLIKADIESLIALTEEKSKTVSHISELSMMRHRELASAGLPATDEGMQQWLKSVDQAAPAGRSWSRLLDLMRTAKELNRTNGILINTHMSRNQAALDVLQQNSSQGGAFYGPNGQATAKPAGRGLVVG